MTLPISLSGSATLAVLCNNLRSAAADGKHEQHELRATPTSLYIKLRSAGCLSRSVKSRTAHQRAVHVLLQGRLEASLQALGAAHCALSVMEAVLPLPVGTTTRPVRVSDVYALERCVGRIEKLMRDNGLRPAQAVNLAIAFQQVHNQALVDDVMLREAARHLHNDDTSLASVVAEQVFKARVTSHGLLPAAPADRQTTAGSSGAAGRDGGELVLTLPVGLFAQQQPPATTASSPDGKHGPCTETGAPVACDFESQLSQPFAHRAMRLLELARAIRATPPGLHAAQELRELYSAYAPLAGSFTGKELLGDEQEQGLARFIQEVQPLIAQTAKTWSTLAMSEQRKVIATLRAAFHQHFNTPPVSFEFTTDAPPARISADGATITLALMPGHRMWRAFDQLVHQSVYGLTLAYQRELAQQVKQADFAQRSPQDQALARIMLALTEVPVTSAVLKEQGGYRPAAARAAEQANASRHQATVLADRVAAMAYQARAGSPAQ